MKNPSYTYRYNFYMSTDFVSQEAWLEDYAQKGLKLDSCLGKLFKFEKVTPFHARYRIEHHKKFDMDEERIADYKVLGWDYVGMFRDRYSVFTCRDQSVTELHTDPELHAWSLRKLLKKQLWHMIWLTLFSAFIFWSLSLFLFQSPTPLFDILSIGVWQSLFEVGTLIFLLAVTLQQGIRFLALWLKLRRAEKVKPRSYKRSLIIDGSTFFLAIFLLICWIFLPSMDPQETRVTLDDYQQPLPFVQLHELEPEQFNYGGGNHNGINLSNYMDVSSTLLMPRKLEARQDGTSVPGSYQSDRCLYSTYYSLSHESLAARLTEELKTAALSHFEDYQYPWVWLDLQGADEAWFCGRQMEDGDEIEFAGDIYLDEDHNYFYTDDNYQFLLLRVGKEVLLVQYQSENDILPFADAYAALLN